MDDIKKPDNSEIADYTVNVKTWGRLNDPDKIYAEFNSFDDLMADLHAAPMSEDDHLAKETLEFWANAVLPGDIG